MDAEVVWRQGLSFTGSAGDGGATVALGSRQEPGGAGTISPMETLLVALAGCTAMDVISILEKKRQRVTAFEVRTHGDRAAEHPRVYTAITVEYVVTGTAVDRAAVERAVELSETKYCSVMAMLRAAVPIERTITIVESDARHGG
jgi:putative redox protein